MEIQELQGIFFNSLLEQQSVLNDFRKGSVIYTLSRAASAVAFKQFELLEEYKTNSVLVTATGAYLDDLANSFNIQRKQGSFATGFILSSAFGNDVVIKPGLIYTDAEDRVRYSTTNKTNITVTALLETKIPVKAIEIGSKYNIQAGLSIYMPNSPNLVSVVGSFRKANNTVCGAISGGSNKESDESLRQRIVNKILYTRTSSQASLKEAILNYNAVDWVSIQTPFPGAFIAWVDSDQTLSTSQIKEIENIVDSIKAAGIIATVKQAERISTNFTFKAVGTDAESVKKALFDYLYSIDIDTILSLNLLSNFIKSFTNATLIEVLQPTTDIVLQPGQVIRPDLVTVAVDV